MIIGIRGIPNDPALETHVRRVMSTVLARVLHPPLGAQVRFVDDNGPKGGVDIRCTVTVRVPFRPSLRVEHMGETARHAFDQALVGLGRQIERDGARAREARRRPKKYYVAKRMLTGAPASKAGRWAS